MLFKYVFDVSQLSKDEINELYENLEQHSFMTGIEKCVNQCTLSLYAYFEREDMFENLLKHQKDFKLPNKCTYFKCP